MAKLKTLLLVVALTLLFSLVGIICPISPAEAAPDEVKWSRVSVPTEGESGDWLLAGGSDVQHLTMAIDGTLYCYASPSVTDYTLFKSTSAGRSWSHTGEVKDTIVDIATAPDDANIVYYATVSNIYKSTDAGKSFTPLPPSPGNAGSGNITITALDVTRLEGSSIIAAGTRDADDSQYGGVYVLDEAQVFPGWLDTNTGDYDVCAVAFSPNFAADRQLVAVVTDEKDTLVTTRIDDGDWGRIIDNAIIENLVAISATIAFPDDYDAAIEGYTLFMAIDTGSDNGDVYVVYGVWAPDNSVATDLNIGSIYNLSNIDVTSLAVSGNAADASLLAGAANSNQVYISNDSGLNWARSGKEPTGQSKTCIIMAFDFNGSRRAYTATSGTESAFSYTTDGGVTWNQIGLIDTEISNIIDLAVSPNYIQDKTLFMLTWGGKHSLWRSLNGGANWERMLTGTLANAGEISLVELSPKYGNSSQVVFLAGTSGSNSAIWKSKDNGQTFVRRIAPSTIDTWIVVNDDTLFLASYNGSDGLVYCTTNGGYLYSPEVVVGSQPLKSVALSPSYEEDETILTGTTDGWVYLSEDNGASFYRVGQQLPLSTAGLGNTCVAFDPKFSSNKVIYATSDAKTTTGSEERIYRFIIGKSDDWKSIDSTLPIDSLLNQLAVSANGTLYVTNSQAVDAIQKEGGMERSLNPTYSLGPTFERVIRGLEDGTTLTGLWLSGNQLWSIDTQSIRLMTYTDSLTLLLGLTSPLDKVPGVSTGGANLDWEPLKGTTEYQWQLDYDTDFSTVPTGFEGYTGESSARLPELEMATTYYWRVRATKPVLSRWSAKWSFTTSLGSTVVAPELYSPKAGANPMPPKPIFQWSAIAGTDSYEILVSKDASFSSPVIVRIGDYALPATAWQSDISLEYDTTYYWKVRAVGSSSYSAWSAVGAFTIESPPSPSPSPVLESSPPSAQPPSPLPSSPPSPPVSSPAAAQSTIPGWVIYVGVALLLVIVLLLITLLVLVLGTRRT